MSFLSSVVRTSSRHNGSSMKASLRAETRFHQRQQPLALPRSFSSFSRASSSASSLKSNKPNKPSRTSSSLMNSGSLLLTPQRNFWVSDLSNLLKARKLARLPNKQVISDFGQVMEDAKREEPEVASVKAEDIEKLSPEDPEYQAVFSTQSFNASLEVLLDSENYEAVKDSFYIMLLKGIETDAFTWSVLIDSFKRSATVEDFPDYVETAQWIESGMAPEERQAFLAKLEGPVLDDDAARIQDLAEEIVQHDLAVFAPERPPERVSKAYQERFGPVAVQQQSSHH